MNEGLKKLAEEINGNESLQKKMQQCASADEAFELARTISDGYTQEEFIGFMQKASSYEGSELSEDDLDQVAGGLLVSYDRLKETKYSWLKGTHIPIGTLGTQYSIPSKMGYPQSLRNSQ